MKYGILLEDGSVEPLDILKKSDLKKWSSQFNSNERIIRQTYVLVKKFLRKERVYLVSTVFLGADHSLVEGESIWFETMVFENASSSDDIFLSRYDTIDVAREGHGKAIKDILRGRIK